MSRQPSILCVALTGMLAVLAGCAPQQPFHFFEDGDRSHYIGKATEIEYPDVETARLDEVTGTHEPLTLENPAPADFSELEPWDLTLERAVRLTLDNSKVLRNLSRVQYTRSGSAGSPDALLAGPEAAATVWDPALAESNPRFGVEAALAAFDAQFTSNVFWEKTAVPQNVSGIVQTFRPGVFQQDLGTFQARLAKRTATGATWSLTHNVAYEGNNIDQRVKTWMSDWNVNLEAQFSQPLLQGNGVQFNRIAGLGSIPGFYNGVMIARINTDIALADFEAQVRNLVSDVERAYWGLYVAYRRLGAYKEARDRSQEAWRKEQETAEAGGVRGPGGGWKGTQVNVALTRHQFFWFDGLVEQAKADLLKSERHLRYIMGLAATDGRRIRPADEPTRAKVRFDWHDTQAEALVRSVELRRQRSKVKERELEEIAAKNWLLPRLDAVGRYRWRGLGDRMIDPNNSVSNAYGSMTGGDFQEWQLGLELSIPLGFRKEMAGVRHAQMSLARERAVLQDQENELTHLLSEGFSTLQTQYHQCQTALDRYVAAEEELRVWEAFDKAGKPVEEDRRVAAQQRSAEAEIDFYQSLVQYNLAITEIHFRKGSLLEYNNVYLAEGPWPAKAYFDATRRARARDASLYLDYGFTRPKVISRGAYEQHAGTSGVIEGEGVISPELVPTPAPEPPGPPAVEDRKPEPNSTTGLNRAGAEAAGGRLAAPSAGAAAGTVAAANRSGHDLGSLDLNMFAGETDASARTPSSGRSTVEPVSYQRMDSAPGGGKSGRSHGGEWKSVIRLNPRHESVANPPVAEAHRNASGWKSVQR